MLTSLQQLLSPWATWPPCGIQGTFTIPRFPISPSQEKVYQCRGHTGRMNESHENHSTHELNLNWGCPKGKLALFARDTSGPNGQGPTRIRILSIRIHAPSGTCLCVYFSCELWIFLACFLQIQLSVISCLAPRCQAGAPASSEKPRPPLLNADKSHQDFSTKIFF